jgi:hypothetical protein
MRSGRRSPDSCFRGLVGAACLLASSCAGTDKPRPPAPPPPSAAASAPPVDAPRAPVPVPPDPLDVSPSADAFARAPKLQAKIAKSPYAYFRFINGAFGSVVCEELKDFAAIPEVPLHGDAHLEQYALTDVGRGLTDYDDAATGPAVVDLARMATSIVIAARMRGFDEAKPIAAFVEGYRSGLLGRSAPAPSVIPILRAKFRDAPAEFVSGAEKLMLPEDADPTLSGSEMRATVVELERELRARRKDLAPGFFAVRKLGTFKAGIGSALERKFLVRLEGKTKRPDDDRIIEVKFVGDRTRPPCLKSRYDFDPRDLRDDMPPGAFERFVDPVFLDAKNAWAQEWYPNFQEVEVAELPSVAALVEIARDAGTLLAREHVRGASPENLALDATKEARLATAAAGLAGRVEASWKKFKRGLPPEPKPLESRAPDGKKE